MTEYFMSDNKRRTQMRKMRTFNLGKVRHFTSLEERIDEVMGVVGNNSAKFESEEEVNEYFTLENMKHMFGDDFDLDQDDLDGLASLILTDDDGTFTTFKNIDAELTAEEAKAINAMKKFHGHVEEGDNWLACFSGRACTRHAAQALEWLREGDSLEAEDEIELAQMCLNKNC
jgi:hypothetical protein